MKVVRQRMIKPLNSMNSFGKFIAMALIQGLLSACNPTELTGKGVRNNSSIPNDGSYDNKAFIYEQSPFYLAGPAYGPRNVDMSSFLTRDARLVTTNTRLTGNCTMNFFGVPETINDCVYSLQNETGTTQPLPRNSDRTYIFPPNSAGFYQTNALYHISQGMTAFFEKLSFAYDRVYSFPSNIPKALPPYLMDSQLFWFKAMSSIDRKLFNFDYLTSYAQCNLDRNASFSPAGPSLCFGGVSEIPGFYFVQDPSIIHHELGHALVSVMMNMRNGTSGTSYHPLRSNLGSFGYNESGAINEGIADYFAYVMSPRPERDLDRMGEFALGKIADQARPYTEAHSSHIEGISETPEGRLSYPEFLLYDPNFPDEFVEDKHYAGQIISHYLVALTKSLKNNCSLTSERDGGHGTASSYVMLLLAETLSELGDLNARGIDGLLNLPLSGNYYFTNLDYSSSYLWTHSVNAVTYRRFSQVFAKNIYKYMSSFCPAFDKNKSEKLLDDYGLLLFKTYNNNGTSTKSTAANYKTARPDISNSAVTLTPVSENNRRKSVLISKQLIDLAKPTDAAPNRVSFYIIDNNSDISSLLQDLLYKGFTVPLTKNVAGTEFNNNNIRISPGEVVAVIPNLINNSNNTMAGIQLLATDWDHVRVTDEKSGNFKPCVIDSITTQDEGGQIKNLDPLNSCNTTETSFDRLVVNPLTGKFPTNSVAPVCFVQLDEGDSSRWVSQNEFRKKQGLSLLDKDCLGYATSPAIDSDFTFNPHECLVRFLPGTNTANFSKIDPQKTYYDSVVAVSETGSFNSGNLLMMEINKWIPPGTKFRCRLRARFSNCSDCYSDGSNGNDDFIDAEYNGEKPFKVINFDFDVND